MGYTVCVFKAAALNLSPQDDFGAVEFWQRSESNIQSLQRRALNRRLHAYRVNENQVVMWLMQTAIDLNGSTSVLKNLEKRLYCLMRFDVTGICSAGFVHFILEKEMT